ncbi:MAG: sulfur oxidation c-type cytochrome SoxX [Pseudomonadota bacterium]
MKEGLMALAVIGLVAGAAYAQDKPSVDAVGVEQVIKDGWKSAPPEWQERLVQDQTMKECTETRNQPSNELANAIMERERAKIVYPPDGKFLGDWKNGEKLAQSGYGMRFTDYPPRRENGGNCYACHQLTKEEVSYGTLGPSLYNYGKLRDYDQEEIKAVYERIYNPHAHVPCANMPRFGANKILTIDQIKDLVALLMDPESPVNK